MGKIQSLEEYLTLQSTHIPATLFIINLCITALLTYLLGLMYVRYGNALSNRKAFASNFVMVGVTTMIIITIVKSSLALSLGLVGALSIVRFRTAIKEPEELAYIFLVIAAGLGMGANQMKITLLGFVCIFIGLWIKGLYRSEQQQQNLFISITDTAGKLSLDQMIQVLKGSCTKVDLKRFDEQGTNLEATFLVEFENYNLLLQAKDKLKSLNSELNISFLDSQRA